MLNVELYLGDCLEILPTLDDSSVDLIFIDPPYNIGKDFGPMTNDSRVDYSEWHSACLNAAWNKLKQGGSLYTKNHWKNIALIDNQISLLRDSVIRNIIVWQKGAGLASKKCYSMRWEAIWFVTKGDEYIFNLDDIRIKPQTNDKRNNPNGKNPTDCWYIPRMAFGRKDRPDHPTPTPPELLVRIIKASSNKGDTILDPFFGSGTTGVACMQTERNFIGIEIAPDYYAIAEKRIKVVQAQLVMPL